MEEMYGTLFIIGGWVGVVNVPVVISQSCHQSPPVL